MDISNILKDPTDEQVPWHDLEVEEGVVVRFQIKTLKPKEIDRIGKRTRKGKFNKVQDDDAFHEALLIEAVKGWSELMADGKPYPFNRANLIELDANWRLFREFWSSVAMAKSASMEEENEAERGN
jgi:hypothetical protein